MNAILVGVNINNDYEFDYSIQELENLVKALDIHKIITITQNLKEPNDFPPFILKKQLKSCLL